MARKGTITLYNGTGKTSGKSFTALKLTVDQWSALHFPTLFEKQYLDDYLKDGKTGEISLSDRNQTIVLTAGEYVHQYYVESNLEYKYINNQLETPAPTPEDSRINLDEEDEIDNTKGLFS